MLVCNPNICHTGNTFLRTHPWLHHSSETHTLGWGGPGRHGI